VDWENWNRWTLRELPRLNSVILVGDASVEVLTDELRRVVLQHLPAPDALSATDARRLLVILGLAGASVARHRQEADLSLKERPNRSFAGLATGPDGMPFLEYFAALAAASRTGHPPRDCYASLVRWNGPETRVQDFGETVAVLPGSFGDPTFRTYTQDAGERAFFELLKKSEALELAANELLEPLAAGSIGILSPDASRRAVGAARLLAALIRLNQDFANRPSAHGGLSAVHFMDVFRQFAVHWRTGDLPPSGAQDPEFLRRDLLLGIDLPAYPDQVRRIFPALLDCERAALERCLGRVPLPTVLLDALGLSVSDIANAPPARLLGMARAHPQLAAWGLLLGANAKFGAVHLMLTEKYLFKPQRARDQAGRGDRALVSNRRGTTGMDEPLLVRLTRARRSHPLRAVLGLPARELAGLCGLKSIDFAGTTLPEVQLA